MTAESGNNGLDLEPLLDALRGAGYRVGVEEHVAAVRLLLNLTAVERLPDDSRGLAPLLGPLFCHTPQEQADFPNHFNRWLASQGVPDPDPVPDPVPPTPVNEKRGALLRSVREVTLVGNLAKGLIAAVLLLAGVVYLSTSNKSANSTEQSSKQVPPIIEPEISDYERVMHQKRIEELNRQRIEEENKKPITGMGQEATEWNLSEIKTKLIETEKKFERMQAFDKRKGIRKLTPGSDDLATQRQYINDLTYNIDRLKEAEKTPTVEGLTNEDLAERRRTLEAIRTQEQEKLAEMERTTPAIPSEPANTTSTTHFSLLGPLVGFLFFACIVIAWRVWLRLQIGSFVEGKRTDRSELQAMFLHAPRLDLFGTVSTGRAAQAMRRRRPVATGMLDVPATLDATIRRAGWLIPVGGRRRVTPEYLVLVERKTARDQLARWHDELLDRLAASEVFLARFDFDASPRVCRPASGGRTISLPDLAAQFSDHRLLIFSDGAGMISPITGEPLTGLDILGVWPDAALLTSIPPVAWGSRERALEACGLKVVLATADGLARVAREFDGDTSTEGVSRGGYDRFPRRLRDGSRWWLADREPDPVHVRVLFAELRRYLGDEGFYWLAACAVYPVLDWNLTVYLGTNLRSTDGTLFGDDRLHALLRLPWFQHGSMPGWLRLALLAELTAERETAVRTALATLLLSADRQGTGGFPLDVGRDRGGALTALADQLLKRTAKETPEGSPARETTFAKFMSGWKPGPLAMQIPHEVVRRLWGTPTTRTGFGARVVQAATLFMLAVPFLLLGAYLGRSDSELSSMSDFSKFEIPKLDQPENGGKSAGGRLGNNASPTPPSTKEWPVFGTGPRPLIPRSNWVQLIDVSGVGGPVEVFLPPTHNQNGYAMDNCSAIAGVIESQRRKQGLGDKRLSAGDLYKRVNGGVDRGSYLEDGMMAVTNEGIATTNTVPYLDWRSPTSPEAVAERKFYKVIKVYLCPTFDHCMSAVLQGYDLVTGIEWYNSYSTPNANGWLSAPSGGLAGGHALHGYKATYRRVGDKIQFGIWHQNSWGPSWGVEGKCVLSESAFTNSVGGWWAIGQVTQSNGDEANINGKSLVKRVLFVTDTASPPLMNGQVTAVANSLRPSLKSMGIDFVGVDKDNKGADGKPGEFASYIEKCKGQFPQYFLLDKDKKILEQGSLEKLKANDLIQKINTANKPLAVN